MTKKKHKKPKVLPWEDLSALSKTKRTSLPETAKTAEQLHDPGISVKRLLIESTCVALFATAVFFLSLFGKFVFLDNVLTGPFQSVAAQDGFFTENLLGSIISPFGQSWLKATYALDLSSFGPVPFWYHAVNVILHALTCVYFYLLVFQLGRLWIHDGDRSKLPYNIALAASLLLACHPMVVESVAYISGRAGVLTACNLFLTLNLFLLGLFARRTAYMAVAYVACFFTLCMGITSSPEGLAIPFMMFALVFMVKPATTSFSDWFDEKAGEMTVTGLLSLALPFLAKLPFSNIFNNNLYMPPLSGSMYLASQFKGLITYYLLHAILPVGLSVEPTPFIAQSWSDLGTIFGIISLAALLFLTYVFRDKKFIAFSLVLFIAGFLPSLLVIRDEYGADRRFYVSIAGLAILAGYWLARTWQEKKPLALTTGIVAILAFSGLSIWREVAWLTDKRLWLGTLVTNAHPEDIRARIMLSLTQVREGKPAQLVEKDARDVLKDDPNCQPAYLLLGQAALDKRDWHEAKKTFTKALDLAQTQKLSAFPKYQAKLGLAEALVELKEYKEANKLCYEIIAFDHKAPEGNYLMGRSYLGLNQPGYALHFLETAYEQNRNFKYMEPMNLACLETGQAKYVKAAYHSSQLLSRVRPTVAISLIYAQAALELGHPGQCASEMSKVLKNTRQYNLSASDKAKVLYLLSQSASALGKTDEAKELEKRAFKADPKAPEELHIMMIQDDSEKTDEEAPETGKAGKPSAPGK
jgi:protein O-mannosyl-transferase